VIVTGVVLANFPGFRNKSNLDLVAQEVAVAIRQAQTYGIATREKGGVFKSYGVYLDKATANADGFILFANTNDANEKYDSGDALIERFRFSGGVKLKDNCRGISSGGECSTFGGNPTSAAKLNILFQRPDPEAIFRDNSGNHFSTEPSSIDIIITDGKPTPSTRAIRVHRSGHIYVAPQ